MPAQEPCPIGAITVAGPTGWDVRVQEHFAESMRNLGMDDLLVPTRSTPNDYTFTGGVITNGTTAPVTVAAPNVYVTGEGFYSSDAKAYGSLVGDESLEPGESVSWTARGTGSFPIGSATGHTLDFTYVSYFWDDDGKFYYCDGPEVFVP